MRMSDLTTIQRKIDLNYPTNRAIVLSTLAVGVGGTILQLVWSKELLQAVSWGIAAGFTVFLTWALGRELDPEHDLSAFVGAGLALIGLLWFDSPSLMALFWMVVLLRILNRTFGFPARILDSALLLGLGSWLTWQGNGSYGLVTGLAFFLDSRLPSPHRRHLYFAGAALLVTVILSSVTGNMPGEDKPSLLAILAVVGMSILFVPAIVASRQLSTVGDATGEPLHPGRIQAAQVIALLTGIQMTLWEGNAGLARLVPLWAAILGVGLYRLFSVICGVRT